MTDNLRILIPDEEQPTSIDNSVNSELSDEIIVKNSLNQCSFETNFSFNTNEDDEDDENQPSTANLPTQPKDMLSIIKTIKTAKITYSLIEPLLNKCGIDIELSSTLESLTNTLLNFTKTSFENYSSYSNTTIIKKYKNKIKIVVIDICDILQSIIGDDQCRQSKSINTLYTSTQELIIKMDKIEDDTYEFLLQKIYIIITISSNIIIITAIWRKNLTIDQIITPSLDLFHNIIDNIILNLKQDLLTIGSNASMHEPRLITDSQRFNTHRTQNTEQLLYSNPLDHSISRSHGNSSLNTDISSKHNTPRTQNLDSSVYSNLVDHSISRSHVKPPPLQHTPSNEYSSTFRRSSDAENENFYSDFNSKKATTFDQINKAINESYGNTKTLESSTAIDILSMYLKGQKVLYTEGKNYSERYLNMLMIPAMIISSVAGLMAQSWTTAMGRLCISILTTINILLMAFISYLKLDAKAEAHKTSATNYGLLETKCQFLSGKIMYVDTEAKLNEIIDGIEEKVIETKTANQFVLPDSVVASYPEIYNTNVFAKVKIMFITEIVKKNDLKNTVNKINAKLAMLNKTPQIIREIQELEILQDNQLNSIIEYKKNYLLLDIPFTKEINKNIKLKKTNYCCCCFNSLFYWSIHHKKNEDLESLV